MEKHQIVKVSQDKITENQSFLWKNILQWSGFSIVDQDFLQSTENHGFLLNSRLTINVSISWIN